MSDILYCLFLFIFLVVLELFYFRIARSYSIIDKPNDRSSHINPTIRGGGIIFIFSLIFWFLSNQFSYPWVMLGAAIIAAVSFVDDVGSQSPLIRFFFHFVAFLLLGIQIDFLQYSLWIILLVATVSIGTINAFNFMDGINGITGVYALVSLLSFYFIHNRYIDFTEESLLLTVIIAVIIFLYFNFRKKAKCFAGDVGSITLSFIQLFVLLQLIIQTRNMGWIVFFLVFGIDSVVTILYRLRRGENIFRAHRSHLYQYLSNELKRNHLLVACAYGLVQLIINILFLNFIKDQSVWMLLGFVISMGLIYVVIREWVLKQIGVKSFFIA